MTSGHLIRWWVYLGHAEPQSSVVSATCGDGQPAARTARSCRASWGGSCHALRVPPWGVAQRARAARRQNRAMEPKTFLAQTIQGFGQLSAEEQAAIADFTLLWSAMEGMVLQAKAGQPTLVGLAKHLAAQGLFPNAPFQESLNYFRNRYVVNGGFSHHYATLYADRLSKANFALVEDVLLGKRIDDYACLCALLLVIFRIRNNLFHGEKWAYQLQGQLDNFTNANKVLMRLIGLHLGIP